MTVHLNTHLKVKVSGVLSSKNAQKKELKIREKHRKKKKHLCYPPKANVFVRNARKPIVRTTRPYIDTYGNSIVEKWKLSLPQADTL